MCCTIYLTHFCSTYCYEFDYFMNKILLYQIRKLRSVLVLSLKNENVSMLVLVSQFPAQRSARGGRLCWT